MRLKLSTSKFPGNVKHVFDMKYIDNYFHVFAMANGKYTYNFEIKFKPDYLRKAGLQCMSTHIPEYYMPLKGSFEEGQIVFFNESDGPATQEMIDEFVSKFATGTSRVLMWEEESSLYFGVVNTVDGIAEIHYIEIQIGKN